MSKKYEAISKEVYESLVTFAEISDRANPMGRFRCRPVFVPQTIKQPRQDGTYVCRMNHSCFGDFY